jgi:protein SCO1/2
MLRLRILCVIAAALALAACNRAPKAPDFTLTDTHGAAWTLSAQQGKSVALFFGYTHCPDVCPATLATLTHALASLGPRAKDAEIAFITVDPQRDTPAVMGRYVALFDSPQLVGLTGIPAQLEPVMKAYYVWAQRIPGRTKGSYEIAHSSAVYFIGRDGTETSIHSWQDSQHALAQAFEQASK